MDQIKTGGLIRALRTQKGLTQKALAEVVEMDLTRQPSVSRRLRTASRMACSCMTQQTAYFWTVTGAGIPAPFK